MKCIFCISEFAQPCNHHWDEKWLWLHEIIINWLKIEGLKALIVAFFMGAKYGIDNLKNKQTIIYDEHAWTSKPKVEKAQRQIDFGMKDCVYYCDNGIL